MEQEVKRAIAIGLVTGVLSTLFVLTGAPSARAEDPTYVPWTNVLPSLTSSYDPSSEDECKSGKIACVDKVIREMRRRVEPLGKACDHNAVFALAYLRTTQTYRWAAEEPGFFADAPFVNHEDAVFAAYYFDAWDKWSAGRHDEVPEAWRIAFTAADDDAVSGGGDLYLGMSAHVNRDLPFVLAGIGLVAPDGTSRKADHDKVNEFLNKVIDPLLAEEAKRFDPTADDSRDSLLLGYTSSFQLLAAWREMAWRNAERLANAPDAAARAQVAQSIEDYAADVAESLKTAYSYRAPFTSTTARDSWCNGHNGDAPDTPYVFGMPSAW